jgi:hypothetical protein
MRKRIGQIGLVLALASTYILQINLPSAQAANVVFSASFTQNSSASNTAINAWETFRSQLTGSYNSFTWSSTNGNSITVTDAVGVQNLANGLRTATITSATIGSNTWLVGTNCGAVSGYTVAVEFSNTASCNASSTYALRPLIGNTNTAWGGTNEYTVNAPSQTITLTFFENAPSPTTFSTTQTSPTNIATGSTISYSLIMSQSVTGMAAADFQYGGSASCSSTNVSASSGTTFTVTASSCTEGTLILQLKANSVTGTSATGPNTIASANTVVIDRTAPTITSMTGPSNATYIPGGTLTFAAAMSETVTVSGTPRLALTIGSTTRYATYASGSNSRSLIFTYAVQTSLSDIDIDGIAVSTTLDLNSGSIADLATNALSALTFSAPTLTSVFVAQKPGAPTIDSISATSGQLSVNFTAGITNGSSITNYEYSTNNGTNWTTRSPTATTSPIVIAGLTNGQAYPVRIRAVNSAGSGDSSTAVTATPTAVIVGGGSNISIAYGETGTSTTFTATGGTGVYTFTLSSTPSGIAISNAIVSVESITAAGIYTLNVIATDNAGSPQSGSKQIVITVSKASTTITISLPSSAANAALGGAVTITASVSKPGAVNFKLGGTTISGCGASAAATATATCSWTPGALGGASLTAVFTPTDSSNYETATTTTLSITVVNGVSTVTISLTGGTLTPEKSKTINIIAAIDQIGRVTFLIDGKRIPGCFKLLAAVGNKTCSWKPAVQKKVTITAQLIPTNNVYNSSNASLTVHVIRRSGTR